MRRAPPRTRAATLEVQRARPPAELLCAPGGAAPRTHRQAPGCARRRGPARGYSRSQAHRRSGGTGDPGGRAEGGLRPVSSRPTRAEPEQPLLCTRRGHRPCIDGGRAGLAVRCELSGGGRAVPGRRRPRAGRRQMAALPSPRPRAPFYGGGCSLPEQCHFFMNEMVPALECVCHSAT